jgi:hypothetical protein
MRPRSSAGVLHQCRPAASGWSRENQPPAGSGTRQTNGAIDRGEFGRALKEEI